MKRQALTLALLLALALAGRGQDPYPLITIGGVDIFQTEDSITGPNISGYVSYNAETNTLTLNNATINGYITLDGGSLSNYAKMRILGNNTLVGWLGILSDTCSFYGPGSLNINSSSGCAVYAHRVPVITMEEEVVVSISDPLAGIDASYDYTMDDETVNTYLYINNSTLIISATECTNFIIHWNLVDCHIVEPSNIVYNPIANMLMYPDGEWVYSLSNYLEIRPGGSEVSVQNDPECRIEGGAGGAQISYDGKPTPVEVTDMQGRCVSRTYHQSGNTYIPLHPGFYIVKVGNHTKKVVVL